MMTMWNGMMKFIVLTALNITPLSVTAAAVASGVKMMKVMTTLHFVTAVTAITTHAVTTVAV